MYDYKVGDLVLLFTHGDGFYHGDPDYNGLVGIGFQNGSVEKPKTITSIDKYNAGHIIVDNTLGLHSSLIRKAWRRDENDNYILIYKETITREITIRKYEGF